jgi:hypothetical protein
LTHPVYVAAGDHPDDPTIVEAAAQLFDGLIGNATSYNQRTRAILATNCLQLTSELGVPATLQVVAATRHRTSPYVHLMNERYGGRHG